MRRRQQPFRRQCPHCPMDISAAHYARHIQTQHPQYYSARNSQGTAICPICNNNMTPSHLRRHMRARHSQQDHPGIRRTQELMLIIQPQDANETCPVPVNWMLTFIVVDKLMRNSNDISAYDVVKGVNLVGKEAFLWNIYPGLKKLTDMPIEDYLEMLQCYGYISVQIKSFEREDGDYKVKRSNFIKGPAYHQAFMIIRKSPVLNRIWTFVLEKVSFSFMQKKQTGSQAVEELMLMHQRGLQPQKKERAWQEDDEDDEVLEEDEEDKEQLEESEEEVKEAS